MRHRPLAATVTFVLALHVPAFGQDELFEFTHGGAGSFTGSAVAFDGTLAAAGAPPKNRVFVFDVNTGQLVHTLQPSNGLPDDRFGYRLATDGGRILVGAHYRKESRGAAYLFDAATGQELLALEPATLQAGDEFGVGLALAGDIAVVGAAGDDTGGTSSGSLYAFDVTTGQQLWRQDGHHAEHLGYSVAIEGGVVYAGGDWPGLAGAVTSFDLATGLRLARFEASDSLDGDRFGCAIAAEGARLVVGALLHDERGADAGAAYLFDAQTGQQIAELLPDDLESGDSFGGAVAIDGGIVAVGSPADGDNGGTAGAIYLFDAQTGQQLVKLRSSDSSGGLGSELGFEGGLLVAGAPYLGPAFRGAVYVFEPCPTTTKFCGTAQNPENAATIGIDTCESGAASIEVRLAHGPDGQAALLLVGDGTVAVHQPPGSIGDLCIAGGACLGRFDKDLGDVANGGFVVDVLAATSQPCGGAFTVVPGATWNFQFWHRLPSGSSSFSEALGVTFR